MARPADQRSELLQSPLLRRLLVLRHPAFLVSAWLASLETSVPAFYGRSLVARQPFSAGLSLLLSFAGAVATYLVIIRLTARRRWLRRVAIALVAFTTVGLQLIYFGIYREFSTLPTVSIADFVRQSSGYACALFLDRLDAVSLTLAIIVVGAVALGVRRGFEARLDLSPATLLVLASVALASQLWARPPFMALSQQSAWLLLQSSRGPGVVNRAWTPDRARPPRQPAAHPANVLLFRLEEVAAAATTWARPELPTTPRVKDLLEHQPGTLFVAPRHFSNSTATDVSVPSLFEGLSPAAPLEAHRRVPILWDYFAAAGYDTSLFLPDHLKWGDFEHRFMARPGELNLSKVVDATNAGLPLVYDHSLNDTDVLAEALRYQRQRAWAEPFLQIVSLRMPHAIGEGARINHLDYGPWEHEPPQLRDYYNGIRHDDELMAELITAMPRATRDRTLVVIASDHGTRLFARDDGAGELHRLDNYHVETTRVPFIIEAPAGARIPPTVLAQLRRNLGELATSNIDIVPTLLGLVGIPRVELVAHADGDLTPDRIPARHADLDLDESLVGRDLTQPQPPTSAIVQCNTGPLRHWDHEHFALLLDNGTTHYFFAMGRELLFHLPSDPLETHDLAADPASSPLLGQGRALAANIPELSRIQLKYRDQGLAAAQPLAAAEAAAVNPPPPPTTSSVTRRRQSPLQPAGDRR